MDDFGEVRDLTGDVEVMSNQHIARGPYSTVYRGRLKSTNELVGII
jgi:hypothetical protein